MRIVKRLYTRTPQEHDDARFEYHEEPWTVPNDLAKSSREEKRHEATEAEADRKWQNLPGDSNDWTLDYIFIEGDPVNVILHLSPTPSCSNDLGVGETTGKLCPSLPDRFLSKSTSQIVYEQRSP